MQMPDLSVPEDLAPDRQQEDAPPATLQLSLTELDARLDGFVTEYLAEKSKETAGTYRRTLNEFERFFALQLQQPPHERFQFREEDVEAYKRHLTETRELSQVSVSTYLTGLRRFCQYLVDRGDLPANPAKAVKGNRRPTEHTRRVLGAADVERLMEVVPADTTIGLRDRALMALMLYAGLAEIELVRANVEDFDPTLLGHTLRVQGKGHTEKDQQVTLDPAAADALERYLDVRESRRPSDPLFVSHGRRSEGERLNTRSVRARVNAHLKAAGLKRPGITPHSLTHTAPLIWLNDGMSVDEVRRRMRHGTLDTTMIYFKKQGLLRRAIDDREM